MEIPLTQGKVAIIDDADWPLVKDYKWRAQSYEGGRYWYAVAWDPGQKKKLVRMHRLIARAKSSEMVDHKGGDGLVNIRSNLRPATNSQNQANSISPHGTSRHKGVSWSVEKGCWRAAIYRNGKTTFLGYFGSEEAAALAYNKASAATDGEFAKLNDVNQGSLGKDNGKVLVKSLAI